MSLHGVCLAAFGIGLGQNDKMARYLTVRTTSRPQETTMHALSGSWQRLCSDSAAFRFIDINLRGIGQVMFQNHPLSGALFLAAIAWGSVAADAVEVLLGAVLALVSGTLTAMWLKTDAKSLAEGLYGYNAVLVGLALPTFLAPSPLLWCYVVLGGAVSVVCMLGMTNVGRVWGVAALTFPFVLTSWLLLLATYGFSGFDGTALPFSGEVVPIAPEQANLLDPMAFIGGVLKSVSQVFLKADAVSALLLLAGLAVGSVPAALVAFGAALLAVVTAHALGAEAELISAGLLGFSPVLTAIALGTVFYTPSARVLAYAALGTVFTVIVQGAMNVALVPFGIPTLTAPFVLAAWLFGLPQQHFGPTAEPADAG
jgi:urea transporter